MAIVTGYEALLLDSGGQQADMQFSAGSDATKIATFCSAHSSAGLRGINKLTDVECDVTTATSDSDVQRRLFVYGKIQDTGEPVKFSIPAPSRGSVQTEDGERLDKTSGQDLCDKWGILLGLTAGKVKFKEGIFVERM